MSSFFFNLLEKWPDIMLIVLSNICVIDQTRGHDGLVVGIGPVPFLRFRKWKLMCLASYELSFDSLHINISHTDARSAVSFIRFSNLIITL